LMSTMSINVHERAREIGVMRAIGASDAAVLRSVVVEGVCIGVLSWPIGAVLALPISTVLSTIVGDEFTGAPLSYTFSLSGALFWLVLAGILAALASFLPAWNATRLSVHEVLSYE
jgi:putative ABC transport system permease protein